MGGAAGGFGIVSTVISLVFGLIMLSMFNSESGPFADLLNQMMAASTGV